MTGPYLSKRRGFTLIEVMISLMVLVILTLIFAACVPVARRTARMNGEYSQAISLCQHKIDELRAVGYGCVNYDELSSREIIDEAPYNQPFSFTGVDHVSDYLNSPTATLTVENGDDEMKVTAAITWKSAGNGSKTSKIHLSAIITNVE